MPGGGWLAVDPRSDEPVHNATLFDAGGTIVGTFHAGDAIRGVQVTPDGRIWISNFDEMLSRHSDLGDGLICIDQRGLLLYAYTDSELCNQFGVTDCYALNVVDDKEAWFYCYTDFPLICVTDYRPAAVLEECPVAGAHAFAIHGGQGLFGPGYGEQSLALIDLHDAAMERIAVVDESGRDVPVSHPSAQLRGRGPVMLGQAERSLYQLDMRRLEFTR
jgi:hypothetical protein